MKAASEPSGSPVSLPELGAIVDDLRASVRSRALSDESARRDALRSLIDLLDQNEARLYEALRADLGKCQFEAYGSEIGLVRAEAEHALAELRDWMRPRDVPTPLAMFPSRSRIRAEPKGLVLILSPWNYPLQLCLDPLVAAIAAGNAAIVKPSEYAPTVSALLEELFSSYLSPDVVRLVTGDGERARQLLEFRFDHIFFTGSTRVGRLIAEKAARTLTPTTLELGGKSPVVVDRQCDMGIAAKRIVWGKFWNAGQSCVAPDYVLVERSRKPELIEAMIAQLKIFFGSDAATSDAYGRIVSVQHFDRLAAIMEASMILTGGALDRSQRYIEPTLVDEPTDDEPSMTEEIFGPLLPIIGYDSLDEAIEKIARHPEPLALYVFSSSPRVQTRLTEEIRFGGGCINDTLVQFASPWLPFGGRGNSGHGRYHGKFGFDTFSHLKSVVTSPTFPDIPIRYPPFRGKLRWLKWFM